MAAKTIIVYTYSGCGSCRKAIKWLRENEIAFREKPIRESPPSKGELGKMLAHQNGELRKLFNTSGQDYRSMDMKNRLPTLSEAQALDLLSANGNLVKRPFLLGPDYGLVGFNETAWMESLGVSA